MTNTKSKKSAKQKKVLVASVILAGMIVAGGTFAWLQSTDKVTNQLSASSTYNVVGTETFTPPEQWYPGQEINKDYYAVNTGNVDAFVRASLANKLTITNYTTEGQAVPSTTTPIGGSISLTDPNASLVTLNKTAAATKEQITTSGLEANAVGAKADEVTPLQAGGKLVYAADKSVKPSDTQDVDGSTYKPYQSGLYIFQREKDSTATTNSNKTTITKTYEYTGYYYVASSTDSQTSGGNGTYYAINISNTYKDGTNDKNTFTVDANGVVTVDTKGITLKTTKTILLDDSTTDSKLKVDYSDIIKTDNPTDVIIVTYDPDNTASSGDEVIIDITLKTGWRDNWVFNANDKKFYLKTTLAAGATSGQLIDSVTLDKKVQDKAYTAFDYDLTITLDSVQVAYNEKKEDSYKTTAVKSEWSTSVADTTSVSGSAVTWAFKSNS